MKKLILIGCVVLLAGSLVGCGEFTKGLEDGMGKGSNSGSNTGKIEDKKE